MTRHRPLVLVACSLCAIGLAPAEASAANVLVISNQYADAAATDIASNTSHTTSFFDADPEVPTLEDLQGFDVVLLFEDGSYDAAVDVGAVVREYVEAGGHLVTATFVGQGNYGTLEEIDAFTDAAGGCEYNADDMNTTTIVANEMTAGLNTLSATQYRGGATAAPDTIVVAEWTTLNPNSEQDPLIGYRQEGSACITSVSIIPHYEFIEPAGYDGDYFTLWENVLAVTANGCSFDCGNGELDENEDCDDGDETATCDGNCTFVECGDGDFNATAGEACDDAGDSAECDFDCSLVECGDDYINTVAEDCDDGTGVESMTCDGDCTTVACGDGYHNAAAMEDCDDAGDSATCNADCSVAMCGDGYTNAAAMEDCDAAGESARCDADCTVVECGDAVINKTAGETCDDGGNSPECNANCTAVSCGDGFVNEPAGEECDGDGKGTPGETAVCDEDCTSVVCGDEVINDAAGEECDDGNGSDEDGCSSLCIVEEIGSSSGDSGSSSESGGGESSSGGGESDTPTSSTTEPTPVDPDSSTGDDGSSGDTGSQSGDGGCGCTSRPRDGGGLFGLLLLGLAAIRRRRA